MGVNLFVARATRKDPADTYSMCANPPSCLGTYWCSQWGCCKPPEVEMDDSDFKGPSAKKKTTLRFASPVSPSKMNTICRGYVPQNTKKGTSGQCTHLSSGEISGTRKAARNALQICWRNPLQIALTAGCLALWWKLDARMENRTRPVAFQTYCLVFIATAKNATVTAQIS